MIEDFRLRVFKTVAEKGSFTKAAKALGITQPAVSQNVAEIEKNVGKELFIRERGAVVLTDAGKSFLSYAERILYWYDAADRMFGNGRNQGRKTLRIAADTFIQESVLPKVVPAMTAAAEGLTLRIFNEYASEYDVRLFSRRAVKSLTIEDSSKVAASVEAAVVCSNQKYSQTDDIRQLRKLAVWSPYSELLTPDITARTAFYADSPALVCRAVMDSSELVGIIPVPAVPEGLLRLPIALGGLRTDIMMEVSGAFSDDSLLQLLKESLEGFEEG